MKNPEAILAMLSPGPCIDVVYIKGVWRDDIALRINSKICKDEKIDTFCLDNI